MALLVALGRIVIPVLVQQILDKGILGTEGFQAAFTFGACGLALAITIGVTVLGRLTYIRLVKARPGDVAQPGVNTFTHIHSLGVADHNEAKRGALTSRVTSDVETLARCAVGRHLVDRQHDRHRRRAPGDGGVPVAPGADHVGRAPPLVPLMRVLQRRQ